jgi:hypothetical protein
MSINNATRALSFGFDDASSRRTQRTHPLGIGSDINHHHRPDAVHPRLWSRCSSTPFRPPRPIGRPPRRRPPRRRSRCRPLPAPPPGSAGSPTTPSAECSTPPAIRGRCNTAYPPPPPPRPRAARRYGLGRLLPPPVRVTVSIVLHKKIS